MWRTLPSATSSARAPTVSSIGRLRVDPVLVVEVDVVGAEPPQRSFERGADVSGCCRARATAGVGDQPELGGEHHLVAAALEGAADELLVGVRARRPRRCR